jgi:hypothetical protein
MSADNLLLLGCGILAKETQWLIAKNSWPLSTMLLDSSLHINLEQLSQALTTALAENQGQDIIVFYGCCHPRMENILQDAGTFRTPGQNCVDILLGNDRFTTELSQGAYFLFEDWARRWQEITEKTFGKSPHLVRDIFQGDHKYLLCLRTPCSGDFAAEAEEAGRQVGLPCRWLDVSLDHLESVLKAAVRRKMKELRET